MLKKISKIVGERIAARHSNRKRKGQHQRDKDKNLPDLEAGFGGMLSVAPFIEHGSANSPLAAASAYKKAPAEVTGAKSHVEASTLGRREGLYPSVRAKAIPLRLWLDAYRGACPIAP